MSKQTYREIVKETSDALWADVEAGITNYDVIEKLVLDAITKSKSPLETALKTAYEVTEQLTKERDTWAERASRYVSEEQTYGTHGELSCRCENLSDALAMADNDKVKLEVQLAEANQLLDEFQWGGGSCEHYCPCCNAFESDGHAEDCRLGAYLKKPKQ